MSSETLLLSTIGVVGNIVTTVFTARHINKAAEIIQNSDATRIPAQQVRALVFLVVFLGQAVTFILIALWNIAGSVSRRQPIGLPGGQWLLTECPETC